MYPILPLSLLLQLPYPPPLPWPLALPQLFCCCRRRCHGHSRCRCGHFSTRPGGGRWWARATCVRPHVRERLWLQFPPLAVGGARPCHGRMLVRPRDCLGVVCRVSGAARGRGQGSCVCSQVVASTPRPCSGSHAALVTSQVRGSTRRHRRTVVGVVVTSAVAARGCRCL